MAVEGVQGLTGSPGGIQLLSPYTESLLPVLFLLVPDKKDISKAALTALVNLSQVMAALYCPAVILDVRMSESTVQMTIPA